MRNEDFEKIYFLFEIYGLVSWFRGGNIFILFYFIQFEVGE